MTPTKEERDHMRKRAEQDLRGIGEKENARALLRCLDALDAAEASATEHPDELRARRKLQVIEPEYAAIMALLTDESMSAVEQIEALQKRAAEGAGDTGSDTELLRWYGKQLIAEGLSYHQGYHEPLKKRALALARGGR